MASYNVIPLAETCVVCVGVERLNIKVVQSYIIIIIKNHSKGKRVPPQSFFSRDILPSKNALKISCMCIAKGCI